MEKYIGKSVYNSIAMGEIKVYKKTGKTIIQKITEGIKDAESEKERFETAMEEARQQLENLYEKVLIEVGEESAAIFQVHSMMLEDLDYLDSIYHKIEEEKKSAEYAVAETGDYFAAVFSEMDNPYMKERAADIKDVSERLLQILTQTQEQLVLTKPVIILSEDMTPSETMQLDKQNILAFVTRLGSVNSHTAILARMMNVAALVGTPVKNMEELEGAPAIVDGEMGILIVNPDAETLEKYRILFQLQQEKGERRKALIGKETITLDGTKLNLYANMGGLSDLKQVIENDAGGIGLFRSEFLYLEKDNYPSEEEQFLVYKQVTEAMKGKKVIIRTLDIGADKQAPYFNLDKEENPAMGYRAIRICLDRVDVFKTQLRALFRASHYGNLAIMYPMIISVDEVRQIKKIVQEVREELESQKIPYDEVEQGIMIETPAAVMISDLLAEEVDFFSIGTNDLTQYTLAIDRQNQKLGNLYDSHHEAVLRMIQMTVENGHKAGIWVGICGELGADISLTGHFLKMGVDELSVSPPFILPIREYVRNLNLGEEL
jgi:phosphotransferase system enzyme I (PtsI)